MSLQTGRVAIEGYVTAQWQDEVPLGLDDEDFAVSSPSVRMTISEGAVMQGSVGQDRNTVYQVGVVTFQIFTASGSGSTVWRDLADGILDMFHGVALDARGVPVTSQAQAVLVRFSPPELGDAGHPYIAAKIPGSPYNQVNVAAPFVRYERR